MRANLSARYQLNSAQLDTIYLISSARSARLDRLNHLPTTYHIKKCRAWLALA
eukprot:COSAG02_NODE_29831_length_562_cov_0.764579_1_plen_52_part_01